MRAVPRYHTPRDTSRPTLGGLVTLASIYRGRPQLEWQRRAWDVALELRDDGRAGWRYPYVVLTVPRQAGKTDGSRSHDLAITSAIPNVQCLYTAQTGKDARARWIDTVSAIKSDPAAAEYWQINVGNQAPLARSKNSGSLFSFFAPGPDCLHGWSPDIVKIDEAFAHSDAMGALLMGAAQPAQQTRPWRQLWIISTRGPYGESPFLDSWVARAEADTTGRICLIDYSAPPHLPTYDEDTWANIHPALGTILLDVETIWDAATNMTRAEFERAYLNRSIATSAGLVTTDEWAAVELPEAEPIRIVRGAAVLGVELAADGSRADIVAAWPTVGDSSPRPTAAALLQRGPGSDWLADALVTWRRRLRPRQIRILGTGATRATAADLAAMPELAETLEVATDSDLADATLSWLTAVRRDGLVVHHHPALATAAAAADLAPGRTRRPLDRARANVGPVIADALAHAAASRLPAGRLPTMWLPDAPEDA